MQHLVRITITFFLLCLTSNVVWSKSHIINLECYLTDDREQLNNSISINKKTKTVTHLNHLTTPKGFSARGVFAGRFVSYEWKSKKGEPPISGYGHIKYKINRETLRMYWSMDSWMVGKIVHTSKIDYPCKIIQLKKNKF